MANEISFEEFNAKYAPKQQDTEISFDDFNAKYAAEPKSRSFGDVASDVGSQLGKGVNTIAGAIPNLLDPSSPVSKFFNDNAQYWQNDQSQITKSLEAAADARIAEAAKTGQWEAFKTAVKEYGAEPALVQKLILENIPSMIPGLAAAKGAQIAAKGSVIAGTVAGAGTNSVLNSGGARQESYQDIKKTLIEQGMSEAEANAQALEKSKVAAGVGAATGALSGGSGLERGILGGAKGGFAKRAGVELGGEQLEEVAPTIATNMQLDRDMLTGVGETSAKTLIASSPGSVISGFQGNSQPVQPTPPGATPPTIHDAENIDELISATKSSIDVELDNQTNQDLLDEISASNNATPSNAPVDQSYVPQPDTEPRPTINIAPDVAQTPIIEQSQPIDLSSQIAVEPSQQAVPRPTEGRNVQETIAGAKDTDKAILPVGYNKPTIPETQNQPIELTPETGGAVGIAQEQDRLITRLRNDARNVFLGDISSDERAKQSSLIDNGIVDAVNAGVPEEQIYNALYAKGVTSENLAKILPSTDRSQPTVNSDFTPTTSSTLSSRSATTPASTAQAVPTTDSVLSEALKPLRTEILKFKGEGKTVTGSKVIYDATDRLKAIAEDTSETSLKAQQVWFNSKRKTLEKNGDTEAAALFERIVAQLKDRINTAQEPAPVKIDDQVATVASDVTEKMAEVVRDATIEERIASEKARPVNDLSRNPTESNQLDESMRSWELDFGMMGKYTYRASNQVKLKDGETLVASTIYKRELTIPARVMRDYGLGNNPSKEFAFRVSVIANKDGETFAQVERMTSDNRQGGNEVVAHFEVIKTDLLENRALDPVNNFARKFWEQYGRNYGKQEDLISKPTDPISQMAASVESLAKSVQTLVDKQNDVSTKHENLNTSEERVKESGESGQNDSNNLEYAKPSTIDTPAQGVLNQAREGKAKAWEKVQSLRERIKNEPLGGNRSGLRLELVKAEDKHREYQKSEKEALAAIEKRANELGLTTVKTNVLFSKSSPTINIDGIERSRLNSNGKPIANTDEALRNFWEWFSDSKVVDEDGRPLIVYHGTDNSFDEFSKEKIKSKFDYSFGLHFTNLPKEASHYAETDGNNGNVMPVYLKAANPLLIVTNGISASTEADLNRYDIIHKLVLAKRAGDPYDSVIIKRQKDDEYDGQNIIVFDPNQVKSATGNSGNFSKSDNSILKSQSTPTPNTHTVESATSSMLEAHTGKIKSVLQAMLDNGKAKVVTAEQAAGIVGEDAMSSDAQAFYNPADEVTYFVADQIPANYTAEQFKGLVLHEIAVHARELGVGQKEFKNILSQVEFMAKSGNKKINKAMEIASRALGLSDLSARQILMQGVSGHAYSKSDILAAKATINKLLDDIEIVFGSFVSGSVSADAVQDTSNRGWMAIKNLADLGVKQPTFPKGFSSIDINRQRVMLSGVRDIVGDDKVFNSIVELLPVDMVNMLIRGKLSFDKAFDNISVLKNSDPVNSDSPVSSKIDIAGRIAMSIRHAAIYGATNHPVQFSESSGININSLSALSASAIKADPQSSKSASVGTVMLFVPSKFGRMNEESSFTTGTINSRHDVTPVSDDVLGSSVVPSTELPPIISKELLLHETLAYAIQHSPQLGIAQRVIAWFRNAIRAIGKSFPTLQKMRLNVWANNLNESDLRFMAESALKNAEPSGVQNESDTPQFSKSSQTDTPAFKKWFGGSKVVNADGTPMVVYHGGTTGENIKPFAGMIWLSENKDYASSFAEQDGGSIATLFASIKNPLDVSNLKGEKTLSSWRKFLSKNGIDISKVQLEDWAPEYGKYTFFDLLPHAGNNYFNNRNNGLIDQIKNAGFDGIKAPEETTDWIKSGRTYVVFDSANIKSATNNNGNFSKSDNNILFSKNTNPVTHPFQPENSGKPLDSWIKIFTRNQIVTLYRDSLIGKKLEEYKELRELVTADTNKLFEKADSFLLELRQIPKGLRDAFASLAHDSTLNNVDPSNPKYVPSPDAVKLADYLANNPTNQTLAAKIKKRLNSMEAAHKKLHAEFSALPTKEQDLFKELRSKYTEQMTMVFNEFKNRIGRMKNIDPAIKASSVKKLDEQLADLLGRVYFPLYRAGNYIVKAEKAGEPTTVDHVESNFAADRLEKKLKKLGYTVSRSTRIVSPQDNKSGEALNAVRDLLDKAALKGKIEGAELSQLMDDIDQTILQSLPDQSYRKSFIHRKGTKGYSDDFIRAYADAMRRGSINIANLRHGDKITTVIEDMRKDVKDASKVPGSNVAALNQVVDRVEQIEVDIRNPTSKLVSVSGKIAFAQMLGSLSNFILNITQTPLLTMPHLGAEYGYGKANLQLSMAYAKQMRSLKKQGTLSELGKWLDMRHGLVGNELDLMQQLHDSGALDLTQSFDLIDAANNPSYQENELSMNFMKVIALPQHVSEIVNRQVTALATIRLEMARSGSPLKAYHAARKAIDQTHFDYSKENRAKLMTGNTQSILFRFKQYAQQAAFLFVHTAKLALDGSTKLDSDGNKLDGTRPSERTKARKQLAGVLGMQILVAGTLGLPVFAEAAVAASGVAGFKLAGSTGAYVGVAGAIILAAALAFGDDDGEEFDVEVKKWFVQHFGKDIGSSLADGIIPRGLASRLNASELVLRRPKEARNSTDFANQWMISLLGAFWGGTVYNAGVGLKDIVEGDTAKGATKLIPVKAIKDLVTSWKWANDGMNVTNKDGEIITPVSKADIFFKSIGINPTSVVNAREYDNAKFTLHNALLKKQQKALKELREETDKTKRFNAIIKYNKFAPLGYEIDSDKVRGVIAREIKYKGKPNVVTGNPVQEDYLNKNTKELRPAY